MDGRFKWLERTGWYNLDTSGLWEPGGKEGGGGEQPCGRAAGGLLAQPRVQSILPLIMVLLLHLFRLVLPLLLTWCIPGSLLALDSQTRSRAHWSDCMCTPGQQSADSVYLTHLKIGFNTVNVCTCWYKYIPRYSRGNHWNIFFSFTLIY